MACGLLSPVSSAPGGNVLRPPRAYRFPPDESVGSLEGEGEVEADSGSDRLLEKRRHVSWAVANGGLPSRMSSLNPGQERVVVRG